MLNVAKDHGITVDDVYIMTVKQVYELVERGKKLDYLQSRIQGLKKTLEK